MKKISNVELVLQVRANPAWASTLTEPLEVTGFVSLRRTNVTHLSPLLHFTAKTPKGIAADFTGCEQLEKAEGNFAGKVMFEESGIKEIGELTFTGVSESGDAANFNKCKNLKVARGNFPGFVDFSESAVERIADLTVTQCDKNGNCANFFQCENLKTAAGTYHGIAQFGNSGVERIGNLTILPSDGDEDGKIWRRHQATFQNCELKSCRPEHLTDPKMTLSDLQKATLAIILSKEISARKVLKQPTIEM